MHHAFGGADSGQVALAEPGADQQGAAPHAPRQPHPPPNLLAAAAGVPASAGLQEAVRRQVTADVCLRQAPRL